MDKRLSPARAKKVIDLLGARLRKEIRSIYGKVDDTMAQYMINELHSQMIVTVPHNRLYMPWTASDEGFLAMYKSVGRPAKEKGDKTRNADDADNVDNVEIKREDAPGEMGETIAFAANMRKRKQLATPMMELEAPRKRRRPRRSLESGLLDQPEWIAELAVEQFQHRLSQTDTDVTITEIPQHGARPIEQEGVLDSIRIWRSVAEISECFGQGALLFLNVLPERTATRLYSSGHRVSCDRRRLPPLLAAAREQYPGIQHICDLARKNVVEPVLQQHSLPVTPAPELGLLPLEEALRRIGQS
ncbi:hypothetical protein CMQ_3881 [Grosmannia clavigera kw1407]|uniref:Uncharacterized protein n=1 Tax=Grosmannia clavigera (strain kw1407 / UAMH 11150) TaxID=655863 RepID=F0X8R9_GROCL|nr:uncharacterized protein CMQ_3881 [Grosmannia clavigera kw1407]EFX05812.1 hypothetical protein CMQ_3881 [Grosmannia clavigera kw1407]